VARFMYVMSERTGAENSRQHKQQHHMPKTRKHNPPAKVLLFSDICKDFAKKCIYRMILHHFFEPFVL